jgi:hypothetical protein
MADSDDDNFDFSNALLTEEPELFSNIDSAFQSADLTVSLPEQNGQDNSHDLLAPEPVQTDKASGLSFRTMGTLLADMVRD